jgi:hypothetical protein
MGIRLQAGTEHAKRFAAFPDESLGGFRYAVKFPG